VGGALKNFLQNSFYFCRKNFQLSSRGDAEKFSKVFSFKSEKSSQLVSGEDFKEIFQNSFVQIKKIFPVD